MVNVATLGVSMYLFLPKFDKKRYKLLCGSDIFCNFAAEKVKNVRMDK